MAILKASGHQCSRDVALARALLICSAVAVATTFSLEACPSSGNQGKLRGRHQASKNYPQHLACAPVAHRLLSGQPMEGQSGEKAHDTARHALGRLSKRVMLRDPCSGRHVESSADSLKSTSLGEAPDLGARDALAGHVPRAENAPAPWGRRRSWPDDLSAQDKIYLRNVTGQGSPPPLTGSEGRRPTRARGDRVHEEGVEPTRLAVPEPRSGALGASADDISTIRGRPVRRPARASP